MRITILEFKRGIISSVKSIIKICNGVKEYVRNFSVQIIKEVNISLRDMYKTILNFIRKYFRAQ
jgi:hypothetical protein